MLCGDCGALVEVTLVWLTGIRDFLHADESEELMRCPRPLLFVLMIGDDGVGRLELLLMSW